MHRAAPTLPEDIRTLTTFRLPEKTRRALKERARQLGTSQANALGVALGVTPESAFAITEKRGNLVVR